MTQAFCLSVLHSLMSGSGVGLEHDSALRSLAQAALDRGSYWVPSGSYDAHSVAPPKRRGPVSKDGFASL